MINTTEVPLAHILTWWRPGSQDWSWAEEFRDLIGKVYTEDLHDRVRREGIGFLDYAAPVILGADGRVWDGHHRITIAIYDRIPSLRCDVVKDLRPEFLR